MMNHFNGFFLIIIFSVILLGCSQKTSHQNEKPNVLLIIVDDQGYADFEPFENHSPEVSTPSMNRLAEAGTVFTEAYTTAPVCSPSRAGLMTGKNQFRWDEKASWGPGLPDNVKTIAEYLKEAGYTTARIGKADFGTNYHKFDVREYPLNHGYDYFLGFSAHAHDYWLTSEEIAGRTPDPNGTSAHLGPLMENKGYKSYPDEEYLTDIFTNEAIKYLKSEKDAPFFLTLAYNSVHHVIHEVPQKYLDKYQVDPIHNYEPDSMETFNHQKPGSYSAYYEKYTRLGAIQDEDMRKFYLANLDCLDENIGRVLDALKEQGLDQETMIIFVSDNGGSPLTGAKNAPLSAGKYSLWEGGIRVPMAISWPGKVKAGKVETNYVSTTDILPTISNAAGIELTDETIDGIDLLHPNQDRVLVWRWGNTWAVRKGNWKLTNTNEQWGKGRPSDFYIKPISDDLSLKLFNLADDLGERDNFALSMPEKVKELENAYNNWLKENSRKY
ncbi:sulfatase family protein [Draconibacterium mangrovi]|uniref:sulfatase family protein n=1 Tax=Draconibacterium mangrovi TaxID=2697469 RepID=UPI0013D19D0A|nr:sulfatase-like hydrolase/transferase [Draconibacterium mangrovi]